MTTKKTVRIPLAADGIPLVVHPRQAEKTRELPAREPGSRESGTPSPQGAPSETVDDDITVPVQSSIESTLTFEMLRRQSTESDEDDEGKQRS